MLQPTISHVSARYGAPMGRPSWRDDPIEPVRLFRVAIDSGGYDRGGAYWGCGGKPLFCATDCAGFRMFLRADDRVTAQTAIERERPGIRFLRRSAAAVRHWWTCGSGYVELQMTMVQAERCSHSGDCDADVTALRRHEPEIAAQLAALDPRNVRKTLAEYGCWDTTELADHDRNLQRVLWLAASDIAEGNV